MTDYKLFKINNDNLLISKIKEKTGTKYILDNPALINTSHSVFGKDEIDFSVFMPYSKSNIIDLNFHAIIAENNDPNNEIVNLYEAWLEDNV
jgi:hypothetical protein